MMIHKTVNVTAWRETPDGATLEFTCVGVCEINGTFLPAIEVGKIYTRISPNRHFTGPRKMADIAEFGIVGYSSTLWYGEVTQ